MAKVRKKCYICRKQANMGKRKFWGQKGPDGAPCGFGVLVEYSKYTVTDVIHKSYEEVMSTAEFDSCGRVIHTGPAYNYVDRVVEEWVVKDIGWWEGDTLVRQWAPGGKPWTQWKLHHKIENQYGDEYTKEYEASLADCLVHQQMKAVYFTLYYSIIGAGKDYLKIEHGSTKTGRVHNVFRLSLDGKARWEEDAGSYHEVHTVTLF